MTLARVHVQRRERLASVSYLRPGPARPRAALQLPGSGAAVLGILRHSGVLIAGEANSGERNVN